MIAKPARVVLLALMLALAPPYTLKGQIAAHLDVSLPMARDIVEATLAECRSKGFHTAAAVVDRSGYLLAMLRDDRAAPQTVEMARRKAYTARTFRMTTLEFQKRTTEPQYAAQRDVADILALGGGVPIDAAGETIGGIGSAGSTQDTDDACAKAGLAKIADQLKSSNP